MQLYDRFMKLAIEEAKNSLKEGNKGFGAVLIKNGKLIEKGYDTETMECDPTAHAEINVVKKACKKLGRDLSGCNMISTHEPCPMCTGALIWAKVSEIVYGAAIQETAKPGKAMILLSCGEIAQKSPWQIRVQGGVLKEECLKLYYEEVKSLVRKFRGVMKGERTWENIEKELTDRRRKWFKENKQFLTLSGSDVEKAYQLLLAKIGVNPHDAPIIEKNRTRVVFRSKNFCPALEACKILGLDTKEVCKRVYEKPTQKLISLINPRIRFTRNYGKIRPYAEYCEETIELVERATR